jgi:hypothetical protein
MDHMNFNNLVKLRTKQAIRDMSKITKTSSIFYKQCQHGKQSRVRFKRKEYATSKSLELVHTNLCGPSRTKILQGERYFMLFIDYYTRKTWVTFLINKFEAFENFKEFKALVENETDLKIKCLRSNNGVELTLNEFEELC